jgi:drug/metabolite transporter (DMT)-like permease
VVAIALALASSLSWGFADFLAGIKSRTLPVLSVLALSQAAGLVTIAAIVALRGEGPPGHGFALYAALAAVGGTGGLAAFYRGLAVGVMAVVAPISSTAACVPVVYGVATGERPSAAQVAGIVLAIVGVALASREEVGERRGAAPPRERSGGDRTPPNRKVAAGVAPALVAAVAFTSVIVGATVSAGAVSSTTSTQ